MRAGAGPKRRQAGPRLHLRRHSLSRNMLMARTLCLSQDESLKSGAGIGPGLKNPAGGG
jgi:hypothetical protein